MHDAFVVACVLAHVMSGSGDVAVPLARLGPLPWYFFFSGVVQDSLLGCS